MKIRNFAQLVLVSAFALCSVAHAAQFNRGTQVAPYLVYDDVLDVTWGYGWGFTTWQNAMNGVASDPTGGYDWRLPTLGELTYLYSNRQPGVNWNSGILYHQYPVWTSEESVLDAGKAWTVNFGPRLQIADGVFIEPGASYSLDKNNGVIAISVITGDVAAVPEPETYAMLLAGLGLVGWAVRCRRQTDV